MEPLRKMSGQADRCDWLDRLIDSQIQQLKGSLVWYPNDMAETQALLRDTLSGQAAVLSEMSMAYIEPNLAAIGINLGTFELLSAVQATKGRAKQAELARRLGISPPSLCEALKIALRKNLVEQVSSEGDQRAKLVRLTQAGELALAQVLGALADMEALLRRSLDAEKVREATALLANANRILAQDIQIRSRPENR